MLLGLTISFTNLYAEKISIEEFCRAYKCQLSYDEISRLMSIVSPEFSLLFSPDYDFVIVNEEIIPLNQGDLTYKKGMFYIEKKVLKTIKEHIKEQPKQSRQFSFKKVRILIDPGHGGKDSGALSNKGYRKEKDINLKVAKCVGRILRKNGVEVFFTREHDRYLSLEERVNKITKIRADYFISIHANASSSSKASGFEFFCRYKKVYPTLSPSKKGWFKKVFRKDIGQVVDKIMIESIAYEESLLAKSLNKSFSNTLPLKSRGVKRAGFYVIKNAVVPSVLIELGFMTCDKEVNYLFKDYKKLATAVTKGILNHIKEVREDT